MREIFGKNFDKKAAREAFELPILIIVAGAQIAAAILVLAK